MNTDEQRRHQRFDSINLSYICRDKSDKVLQQAMARTINISVGGLLIETHFKMKRGYKLIASIGLEDETADIKGKVVHVQSIKGGKYVAGVEILSIEGGNKERWVDFIKRISLGSADDNDGK
jgi:hypothetical protein